MRSSARLLKGILSTSVTATEGGQVARNGDNVFSKPLGLHALAPNPVVGVRQVGWLDDLLSNILCEGGVTELHGTSEHCQNQH